MRRFLSLAAAALALLTASVAGASAQQQRVQVGVLECRCKVIEIPGREANAVARANLAPLFNSLNHFTKDDLGVFLVQLKTCGLTEQLTDGFDWTGVLA